MGSSFFGKLKMGGSDRRNNGSPSSSSGSSRRSKKGHVDKPKQPQRGLGVAQLEQLRLHEEMERCNYNNPNSLHIQAPFIPSSNFTHQDVRVQQLPYYSPSTTSSSSIAYGFQQNIAMDRSEYETANICWRPNDMDRFETVHYGHPSMDRQFIDLTEEDYQGNRRHNQNIRDSSFWSGSLNSSDDQEVDLELRL